MFKKYQFSGRVVVSSRLQSLLINLLSLQYQYVCFTVEYCGYIQSRVLAKTSDIEVTGCSSYTRVRQYRNIQAATQGTTVEHLLSF